MARHSQIGEVRLSGKEIGTLRLTLRLPTLFGWRLRIFSRLLCMIAPICPVPVEIDIESGEPRLGQSAE